MTSPEDIGHQFEFKLEEPSNESPEPKPVKLPRFLPIPEGTIVHDFSEPGQEVTGLISITADRNITVKAGEPPGIIRMDFSGNIHVHCIRDNYTAEEIKQIHELAAAILINFNKIKLLGLIQNNSQQLLDRLLGLRMSVGGFSDKFLATEEKQVDDELQNLGAVLKNLKQAPEVMEKQKKLLIEKLKQLGVNLVNGPFIGGMDSGHGNSFPI